LDKIKLMRKKIGVYAGSFKPFTVGHADILRQALQTFDEVVVAIGKNPEKVDTGEFPFPTNNPVLGRAHVATYNGLLSDFLNELDNQSDGDDDFYLVRGLRNGADLQYEQNQIQFLKEMYAGLRVVFFICDKKFEHVSSTAVRALKKVSEEEYLKYVFLPVPKPEKPKYGQENGISDREIC
jgi:pantetheine-phosphate adenylyltransferase